MLDQRRRRWANIKPTLAECLVLAGILQVLLLSLDPGHFRSRSVLIPSHGLCHTICFCSHEASNYKASYYNIK